MTPSCKCLRTLTPCALRWPRCRMRGRRRRGRSTRGAWCSGGGEAGSEHHALRGTRHTRSRGHFAAPCAFRSLLRPSAPQGVDALRRRVMARCSRAFSRSGYIKASRSVAHFCFPCASPTSSKCPVRPQELCSAPVSRLIVSSSNLCNFPTIGRLRYSTPSTSTSPRPHTAARHHARPQQPLLRQPAHRRHPLCAVPLHRLE
jgi:hypothetical protein